MDLSDNNPISGPLMKHYPSVPFLGSPTGPPESVGTFYGERLLETCFRTYRSKKTYNRIILGLKYRDVSGQVVQSRQEFTLNRQRDFPEEIKHVQSELIFNVRYFRPRIEKGRGRFLYKQGSTPNMLTRVILCLI